MDQIQWSERKGKLKKKTQPSHKKFPLLGVQNTNDKNQKLKVLEIQFYKNIQNHFLFLLKSSQNNISKT